MSFFQRPHYQSDVTQFILKMKEQKPQLEAGQREGRDLLWDKDLDREEQADFKAARVAQKPYVYQTNHD
ncbi:MAG: DUF3460 family protein [Comamonas sp.]|jgi:hypothetical protein